MITGLPFEIAQNSLTFSDNTAVISVSIKPGATAFTVWNQSVVNEKVYTLSLFSIALVLWLVVHWGDEPPGERRDHWLLLIVYLVALSLTNHQMGLLVGPALAVYVLYTDPRAVLRWRLWVAGLLLGLLAAGACAAPPSS